MATPTSTATSTHSGDGHAAASSRSLIGLAGVVFAVLFVVGFILAASSPDTDASNAEWLKYYANDGNLRRIVIGAYLLLVSGFSFLVLVAGLRERVRSTRESAPVLNSVCWGTGLLAAGFMMVSAVNLAGIAGNQVFGGYPDITDADLLRQNLGVASLVLPGAIAAAIFIAIVATLARRVGVFGTAMTWFSYVVAVVLLGAVVFIPLVALPIWGLVTGIVLLRRG